jgi:[acyl-carrier-protein] S-malonyltransferase
MKKKIAFLFPGQGAQSVGMGSDFYGSFAVARETFEEADDLLKFSLSKLIFKGPAEELTLTKNSQVAIYVVSMAVWRTLHKQLPDVVPSVCTGLSLGEYSALTASNRLSFREGVDLVYARGLYMHEASLSRPGTMAAVLGLAPEEVEKALVATQEKVWVANLNCPGQVVISGTHRGVKQAKSVLQEKGAKRVLSLDVSGAFHSELMENARDRLAEKLAKVSIKESEVGLVMNVIGDFVEELEEVRAALIDQVVSPVYWERGIRNIEKKGIDLFMEIGCGKTLLGMNRKIGVSSPTISVERVEDLERVVTEVQDATTT